MMTKNHCINLLPCFLLIIIVSSSSLLPTIRATQYIVKNNAPNTPGGQLFDREIGIGFTLPLMKTINDFIFQLFQEPTSADRKDVPVLNVYISDFGGPALAYTNGDNINISAPAMVEVFAPRDKVKFKFTSLMYHEMTHIFQWSGNRTAPGGLTEGTADYVMVKSGFYDKNTYTKPGQGLRWDQGFGVTERFLEYCDSLRNGFTADLNKKMRYKYSDNYFVELLGKPVDQLWKEYKAKYGNIPSATSN